MIAVVIPTYNERANLETLVKRVFALNIADLRLFIADDNSPDGTGALAQELARKYPITVFHREKKLGLGKAYIDSFLEILRLTQNKPDYIIQMDADLSHEPEVIPKMLEQIKNCDLVLGSRYIKGGKIVNWDFFRKLISRFGNIYARVILGLPYQDLTGGFKCFRREVLENINLSELSSTGYNFQIETTYRAYQKGYRISEIPISFTERKIGTSKFNLGIILESFWKVLLLRLRN